MTDTPNEQDVNALATIMRRAGMGSPKAHVCRAVARLILTSDWHHNHEAQIRDLLEEREELLTEIRRLQRGNHPAGRALREADLLRRMWLINRADDAAALAEVLAERDAEHEGGGGA